MGFKLSSASGDFFTDTGLDEFSAQFPPKLGFQQVVSYGWQFTSPSVGSAGKFEQLGCKQPLSHLSQPSVVKRQDLDFVQDNLLYLAISTKGAKNRSQSTKKCSFFAQTLFLWYSPQRHGPALADDELTTVRKNLETINVEVTSDLVRSLIFGSAVSKYIF